MFHLLLPLIALLPGMLFLIGVGILLLGIALIIAAIVIFIVRAVRKSKKKGSLITAIILLALGLALEAPVAWAVVQIMAYRTGETVEVESQSGYDSLPIAVAGSKLGHPFEYDGKVLVPIKFETTRVRPLFKDMTAVAKVYFEDGPESPYILFEGELSNGCKYFGVRGTSWGYILAEEEDKVRSDYKTK